MSADILTSREVGVVAIGRNEGERLVACLASLKSQTDSIVYVDSGSTDGSVAAAESAGASVLNMDLVRPFTAARARNEGFTRLKTIYPDIGYVQFIDGDCTLDAGWVDAGLQFMRAHQDVAVVCGRLRERFPSASIYNQLCDFEWNTPVGEATACGGNAMMRVEAFLAAGGFNSELIAGEEPELCLRLRESGWKIWRLDAEMGLHDAAMKQFRQWWVRSVRWGYAMAEVTLLHRSSPAGIWRREMASSVFWGGLLPTAILLGMLVHPGAVAGVLAYFLQFCRMSFARGPASSYSWISSGFLLLAKFPEFQGILKYLWLHMRGRPGTLIEYK